MGAVTDPDLPDPPSAKVVAALLRDEAYETKSAAKKGCESVVRAATGAPIEETAS
jgi:hypothetical protein